MKVKEARNRLSDYSGDDLWSQARTLYRGEMDSIIRQRSYGKPPSRGTVEGVVNEMKRWMYQVGEGLDWRTETALNSLIESEVADTWVRYDILDPRVDDYAKHVRLEMLKGTPLPGLHAMTRERLDALSHRAIAMIARDARQLSEKLKNESDNHDHNNP